MLSLPPTDNDTGKLWVSRVLFSNSNLAAMLLLTEDALSRQLAEWLVILIFENEFEIIEGTLRKPSQIKKNKWRWVTWKPGILRNFQWRSFCPFLIESWECLFLIWDKQKTNLFVDQGKVVMGWGHGATHYSVDNNVQSSDIGHEHEFWKTLTWKHATQAGLQGVKWFTHERSFIL